MESSEGRRRPGVWNPSYIKVGSIAMLANTAIQLFVSAFPLYLAKLSFSPAQIGLVASGYTICTMIMRVFSGNIIDTRGRRMVGILGILIFSIPIGGFLSCSVIAVTIVLRMVQGFGAAATTITTGTMAADVATKEKLTESIAYYGLFSNIATAIGPAIGIALIGLSSPNYLFVTALVVMVICFFLMNSMRYEKTEEFQAVKAEGQRLEAQEQAGRSKNFQFGTLLRNRRSNPRWSRLFSRLQLPLLPRSSPHSRQSRGYQVPGCFLPSRQSFCFPFGYAPIKFLEK